MWWVWLGLVAYLVAFYLMPLSSGAMAGQPARPRGQLWAPLMVLDEFAPRWVEGVSGAAIVQRFEILALALGILLVACAAGSIPLRLAGLDRTRRRVEHWSLSAAVGLNILSLATLGCGLLGWMRAGVFLGVGAVIVVVAVWLQWRQRRSIATDNSPVEAEYRTLRLSTRWLWLALPVTVVLILAAMLPPVDFDVLEYHLQAPKEFYQNGQITFLPHNVYANMPLGAEMLALLGMTVSGDWWLGALVGKTLIAAMAPLAALLLWSAGTRLASPAAGIVAAIVYLTTPWILLVSMHGLNEGAFAFYLLAALYAVIVWKDARLTMPEADRWLALAGFLAGGAVSCKYPAVVYCVAPLTIAIAVWARARFLKGVGVFLLFVALGCGLWFVKNAALAGNPMYPLLTSIFGGETRTTEKDAQWQRAHSPPNFEPGDLLRRGEALALGSDWISPLVVPLALLAIMLPRVRRGLPLLLAGYLVIVFLAWWLLTHRIERFWVPTLSVAALLAGVGATWNASRYWRATIATLLVLATLWSLVLMTSGALADNRYLADLDTLRHDPLRGDPWHVYLNERAGDLKGVLLVGDAQPFDLTVPAFYNTVFDDNLFEQIVKGHSSAEILAALHEHDISHIYVAWGEIERYRSPGNYGMTDFVQPEVFARLVDEHVLAPLPAIEDHSGRMYEVAPAASK